jgi:hypothetical protein
LDILEELRQLQQQFNPPTQQKTDDSYISDAVMQTALYRLDVDESVINDVLLEPLEKRGEWLRYFEGLKK